jgi:hypothetical protein
VSLRVLRSRCRHGAAAHAAVVEAADLDALRRAAAGWGSLLVDGAHGAGKALHLRAPRLERPREPCVPHDREGERKGDSSRVRKKL